MTAASWRPSPAQWAVFLSATLGYGLYYVCRLSLAVVKAPLVAEGALTEMQVGLIGSALFYVYAGGKLVNGFLADHVSLRRFFTGGLLVSAVVNLVLGWAPGFVLFLLLWALNGWVQSMGAPACVVGLTRWFERRQRGTVYGLWSSSHNIGEGLSYVLTAAVVGALGWQAGFRAAGAAGLLGAGLIWFLYLDAPSRADPTVRDAECNVGQEQRAVLRMPLVWCIALASACMYVTRYAVNSWGMFYFQHARGYSVVEAGALVAVSSVFGVVGTVASGWISDVLFAGDRFAPALWFGALNVASLALWLLSPPEWAWADGVAMLCFGLAIGALTCLLGGLMAVDAVPKQAAGAALGLVGIASYVGAGTQDVLSGWLIGRGRSGVVGAEGGYDFGAVAAGWMAAAIVSVVFTAVALRLHRRHLGVGAESGAASRFRDGQSVPGQR